MHANEVEKAATRRMPQCKAPCAGTTECLCWHGDAWHWLPFVSCAVLQSACSYMTNRFVLALQGSWRDTTSRFVLMDCRENGVQTKS